MGSPTVDAEPGFANGILRAELNEQGELVFEILVDGEPRDLHLVPSEVSYELIAQLFLAEKERTKSNWLASARPGDVVIALPPLTEEDGSLNLLFALLNERITGLVRERVADFNSNVFILFDGEAEEGPGQVGNA